MLRIGMRTLNGKARQTAVAAFAHMPPPLSNPFVIHYTSFLLSSF